MKKTSILVIIILVLLTLFTSCGKKDGVTIEMRQFDGSWTPVIDVYGYAFDRDIANVIIEALHNDSNKEGTSQRTYRIVE